MGSESSSGEFLQLGAVLFSESSLEEVLQHAVRLVSQALPSVDEASISLTRGGTVFTSNATDVLALKADQAQYETGGPCVLAIRTAEQHLVRIPTDTEEWPEFSAVVMEAGMRSVLSTPLATGEEAIGALNLYSCSRNGFGDDERRLASEFAHHASILLDNAIAFMATNALADNLQEALASRETIGIATGLLMAQPSRSRQDAFDLLRRASQRENRKLRDIAADIVEGAEERSTRPDS
jgi:GAF domain-containing protein